MKGKLRVRIAMAHEREQLEAIQWRASLNNPGDRDALLAHPDAIDLPVEQIKNGGVFVADVAGSIAGFAAVLPRQDGNSELDALFVEPHLWGQGIGRILVDYCSFAARSVGAKLLHVTGNPHAKDFYLKCGFEEVGTIQTRFGKGLLMQKML